MSGIKAFGSIGEGISHLKTGGLANLAEPGMMAVAVLADGQGRVVLVGEDGRRRHLLKARDLEAATRYIARHFGGGG